VVGDVEQCARTDADGDREEADETPKVAKT